MLSQVRCSRFYQLSDHMSKMYLTPREPRRLRELHKQIQAHPNLSEATKYAYAAGISGFTKGGKGYNEFYRRLWRHLMLIKPLMSSFLP